MRSFLSNIRFLIFVAVTSLFLFGSWHMSNPDWGFYGHRKINRMAIFTLPPEMMHLYKKEIEYITAHAVDPDKRRYATKHEAVRHYIDADHWGTYPFDNIPRNFEDALIKFSSYTYVNEQGDTLDLELNLDEGFKLVGEISSADLSYKEARSILAPLYKKNYYEGFFSFNPPESWNLNGTLYVNDEFSGYGILPYFLEQYIERLRKAFERKDKKRIIQISAEMGHYIGDAHVPLHTTENYNGQLTDQVGIHAFWESRLPELYADEEYDFMVGKAKYIENKSDYFWGIILESHSLLEDVLAIEKRLSKTFPEDKQYCYDERLGQTIRIQCPEYAGAYHEELKGMVEKRMQDAVLSIGDVWYTAWVEAGEPDLREIEERELSEEELKEKKKLEQEFNAGVIKGRDHAN